MKINKLNKYIIPILFILLFLVIYVASRMSLSFTKIGELYINEIMSSNGFTIYDNNGKSSDYIEIYNGYDYDINLEDYYLSDDYNNTKKWKFPEVIIKSKEYLVIFASGKDKVINGEIHTNFKLDKNGESVILSKPDGSIISKIYSNELLKDASYGYNGTEYVYYYSGTPGYENSGEYETTKITSYKDSLDISITEYIVNNINQNSSNHSLIELYNNENYDVNLKGYYLSDKSNNLTKYVFDDLIIKTKDYLVIELDKEFTLDNNSNTIILSNTYKRIIDQVSIKEKTINVSSGLYDGSWYSYNTSSFGKANSSNYIKDSYQKELIINEASSVGTSFIEIKNISGRDINLTGYSIGDKSGYTYNFKDITIKANDYLVVYASDYEKVIDGKIYINMGINNSDEILYLYKNNAVIDTFIMHKMISGVSYGYNNNDELVYFRDITIGKNNSSNYYKGYAQKVNFSVDGGYVNKNTKVTLSVSDDSTIYYTTDGSFPTNKSVKYTGPITITKNTVIKAISYKDGYLESDVISRTYFVDDTHDIAIVSISTNNEYFFGTNGLVTNYKSEIYKKVSFEFYESDGTFGVGFVGDTKIVGQDSRLQPQKSLAIYLRKEYGLQDVTYPFFKENDTITYSSFTLRNSGEDPNRIKLKDAFLSYALKGQLDIDMQAYRPVAVYVNGEYYGLYYMREKVNGDYIESKYSVDKNDFDMIKGVMQVQNGSSKEYEELLSYLKTHDTTDPEVYKYLESIIDIDELINYWVVQTYYANTDTGNISCWKSEDGKWRWVLFDQDWAMFPTTYKTKGIKYPLEPYGHGTGKYFTTLITYKLYQNKEFRQKYIETWSYVLHNTFVPERMIGILDDLTKEIENEMPKHIERWYDDYIAAGSPPIRSMEQWNNNLETMKTMLKNRYSIVLGMIKESLELTDSEYEKYFGDIKV